MKPVECGFTHAPVPSSPLIPISGVAEPTKPPILLSTDLQVEHGGDALGGGGGGRGEAVLLAVDHVLAVVRRHDRPRQHVVHTRRLRHKGRRGKKKVTRRLCFGGLLPFCICLSPPLSISILCLLYRSNLCLNQYLGHVHEERVDEEGESSLGLGAVGLGVGDVQADEAVQLGEDGEDLGLGLRGAEAVELCGGVVVRVQEARALL